MEKWKSLRRPHREPFRGDRSKRRKVAYEKFRALPPSGGFAASRDTLREGVQVPPDTDDTTDRRLVRCRVSPTAVSRA